MKTSASRLKVYNVCPLQFKYSYILKLLQLESEALLIGSAYHKALEEYYKTTAQPTAVALQKMLKKYLENPITWDIVEMEKRIEFTLDDIDLNLVIDRLDTNQIVEYKTSSFDYKEADVNNWQTNLYIWVIWKTTGRILPMVYSVLNKKKVDKPKYKPQIITVTRTEKELEKVEQDLIKEVEKIKKEIFPSNPGSHCFYCPFSTRNNGLGNCKDSL